ncbi:hypothetical protein TNCV_1560631 [Trichonephila clavipes]|nr:hypothetical protein TNCV_1560631 [Trichonephila clavipes]
MQRHTGPAPGIMVWGDIGFHCLTLLVRIEQPALDLGGVGARGLIIHSAIFQEDNARPRVACNVQEIFFTHQIELLS